MTSSQFDAPGNEGEREVESRGFPAPQGLFESTLICPRCQAQIKLTESLAAPLLEKMRRGFDEMAARRDSEMIAREQSLSSQEAALCLARESLDAEVASRLQVATQGIAREEAQKARLLLAHDLRQREENIQELQQALDRQNCKLADAQRQQAALQRKQRELDDARRELELSVEVRVQKAPVEVRRSALKDAQAGAQMKVVERDEMIRPMQRQIEGLKQKAEQGSGQLQGEAQELSLEALLPAAASATDPGERNPA